MGTFLSSASMVIVSGASDVHGGLVGVVARHRHADEVHQVVGGKRHRQGEGADQHDRLEDVPPQEEQDLQNQDD